MSSGRILVTGATGQLGSLIVKHLTNRVPAAQVIAGGRKTEKAPQGVEFRPLDYDQPATIDAALKGVSRVVLVSGNEVGKRVLQHRAVVDAQREGCIRVSAGTQDLEAGRGDTLAGDLSRSFDFVFVTLTNRASVGVDLARELDHGVG